MTQPSITARLAAAAASLCLALLMAQGVVMSMTGAGTII